MGPSLRQHLHAVYMLALFWALAASGQFQQQWEARQSVTGQLVSTTVKLDSAGNIYVLSALHFSNTYHSLLCKYGSSGQQEWQAEVTDAQQLPASGGCLVVDPEGAAYVCGSITDPVGTRQMFTAKYSSTGQRLWDAKYGDPGSEYAGVVAVALDTQTNCYVLGWAIQPGSPQAMVLIKCNSEGFGVWTNRSENPSGEDLYPAAVLVGRSDEVYVVGDEERTFPLGSRALAFKYQNNGQLVWTWHQASYPEYDTIVARAVWDSNGDIVMAGSCWGHWHRSNKDSSWVLKLGANGTEKWSRVYYSWAADPTDTCRDLAIDEEDNSFLLLRSSVESVSRSKVVKYSPSGEMRWVAQHYSPSGVFEDPSAITVDGQGCIHLAGYLEQPNVFSWCEALQVRQYATAALLAKFDTNGSLVWATDSGFTNFQESYHGPSIVSSSDGNIIVTGQNPNCLETDLTLKKYAISPLPGAPRIQVAPQNQTIEMGAAAVFTVNATGAPPLHFQWYINDQPLLGCTNSEMTYDGYSPSPTAFSFSVVITNEIGFTRSSEVRATFPARFAVLGRDPGGAIQLNTEGGYYERFVIQVSTNLVDWSLLTRVQGYNPFYRDFGATNLPRRFYRCLHQ